MPDKKEEAQSAGSEKELTEEEMEQVSGGTAPGYGVTHGPIPGTSPNTDETQND